MFAGGIRPHHYCLPVAKRERHRQALLEAVASGDPHFFLGTDSAPHSVAAKEAACGCAGIFNAPTALELYAEAFEQAGALDKLEAFASINGPRFYGLAANTAHVTLARAPIVTQQAVPIAGIGEIRPFRAGESLAWRFLDTST
jgi:dihydroorotase